MMLRTNAGLLDFNDDVEMEKRVKLFEEIDETLGDFSYSFNLPNTSQNLKKLGFPFPDNANKIIYRQVGCDLLDNDGQVLHKGMLRVDRINIHIECSFLSGNHNWISLLVGPVGDLDFSSLDTELTIDNIANTWDNTEGIIFPIIDTGGLVTRSYKSLMLEDFTGCIFVKTVFKKIFQAIGVKIKGDLLIDPEFDNLIISKLTLDANDIEIRKCYAKKLADQSIVSVGGSTGNNKIIFPDDFTYPFFDGSKNNYDADGSISGSVSRYIADVKMRITLELSIRYTDTETLSIGQIEISLNGAPFADQTLKNNVTNNSISIKYDMFLDAGDYVEVRGIYFTPTAGGQLRILSGSTLKVTPTFVYFTTGKSLVPNWTKQEFIGSVINLFCVICDYEPNSKTITFDFFENIKTKEPIDLSEFITIYDTDFEDFISGFSKKNTLSYQEADIDEIKKYNVQQFVKYGNGQITVANDFLPDSGSMLSSPFKAPISYVNGAFKASLERINLITINDNGESEFTSVSDNAGSAQFNVPDDTIFEVGQLVRISESTNKVYEGEYVISATGSGAGFIILQGNFYTATAAGKVTKLIYAINSNDSVYLFRATKYEDNSVSQFSGMDSYFAEFNVYPNVAYAFFNMLNTGVPMNLDYNQSLSFGSVDDTLSYQRTVIQKSWNTVSRVLNDPVKLKAIGHIPKRIFMTLTPLRPIHITTKESTNLYYLNRIYGYKDSARECEIELIKLS
jgi:hypothetical protein